MNAQAYPDALPTGYQLHWYVLADVLGQGGFGITYRARDTNLDRTVAIKEYLPVDTATRLPDATITARTQSQQERYTAGLEGFLREARTLARFNHRNIVRVHSVFQHNNTAYMVMEYEAGETLATLLGRRGTLPEPELTQMLLPIMDGLGLVHEAGFIHRDIKPENILLRPDGSAVLLDFGSARASMGRAGTMTILVAPGYAPYEQYYAGAQNQGPWTDIYALAATCYRATTGQPPLDAISRSKGVLGSTREMLEPASVLAAGRYSERLLRAIDHGLAFAEKDRPQSLKEWRTELVAGDQAAAASSSAGPSPRATEMKVPPASAPVGRRELAAWVLAATGFGAAITALVVLVVTRPVGIESDGGAGSRIAAAPPAAQTRVPPEASRPVERGESMPPPAAQAPAPALTSPEMPPVQLAHAETPSESRRPEAPTPKTAPRSLSAKPATTTTKATAPSRSVATRAPAQVGTPAPALPAPSAKSEVVATLALPQAAAPAPSTIARTVTAAAPATAGATAVTVATDAAPSAAPPEPAKPQSVARARTEALDPPADEREAFSYYRRLALDGHAGAQFKLGELYATGRGVGQNLNQAYLWFGMAARAGHAQAKARQAQVAANLQPAEVRQVDRYLQRQAPAASESRP